MALGHRLPKELPAVIATADLAPTPAHPFYQRLNRVFQEAGFDTFVEDLCCPYYADSIGRPGIPPGIYFRMLFVGYFEGLDSQRGIAWRCSDSRSVRDFLGYLPTELTPDHSSLTKVRQRLPEVVHEEVFAWVLHLADAHDLRESLLHHCTRALYIGTYNRIRVPRPQTIVGSRVRYIANPRHGARHRRCIANVTLCALDRQPR